MKSRDFLYKIQEKEIESFREVFRDRLSAWKKKNPEIFSSNENSSLLFSKYLNYVLANIPIDFIFSITDDNTEVIEKFVYDTTLSDDGTSAIMGERCGMYKSHIIKYMDKIHLAVAEQGLSYVFSGMYDTGKTFTSLHILSRAVYHGMSGYYFPYLKDVKHLHDKVMFKEHSKEEAALYEYITTCDFLVIDELGKENINDNMRTILEQIIKTRIMNRKPTILVTNLFFRISTGKERVAISSRVGKQEFINEFAETYGYSTCKALVSNYKILTFSSKEGSFRKRFSSDWSKLDD